MQGNRPLVILLTLLGLAGVIYTIRTAGDPDRFLPSGVPSKVVLINGYPELHVDNKPFFMHSAAFYYYRLPRDRWEESLRAMKEHGINTIDLYIIWNWHQPTEETLDLDGQTNPRRDLKGLLKLIADLKFKLSVRPGPFICSEWKNGGYPDWLLRKPEFNSALKPEHQMPAKDILEGRYPRLSALQYAFSEEAADAYLQNQTHLRYTRKWYEDVMQIVRPYLASHGGNVILLQVDDDQGLNRYNYNGSRFWEYMDLLRRYLRKAAKDETIPIYFNPADMRVTAASSDPAWGPPFWAMGQYYQEEGFGSDELRAEDSSTAKYLTEILKTQPGFPPFFIEYQAGWFAGAEDLHARNTDPTNTLVSSRFLLQNGVKGLNYFPLQDTLYPAGYECPWSNYYYTWDSAIGYEGERRARAEGSLRNGTLIEGMGPLLAASHYAADIGVAHSIGTYPQEKLTQEDINGIIFRTMTATQIAFFNQVNAELVDFDYHSLTHLQRYPLILLPVITGSIYKNGRAPGYLEFSARAQRVMTEYVRQGGTVVAYPAPPKGKDFQSLFPQSKRETDGSTGVLQIGNAPAYQRRVGKGSVIVLESEFDRWVPLRSDDGELDDSLPTQPVLTAGQKKAAGAILDGLMRIAGIKRNVSAAGLETGQPRQQPYLSVLEANATTESGKGHAYSFLSITNFSVDPFKFEATVRDPRTGDSTRIPPLEIAGRDALLLPLRVGFRELGITDSAGQLTNDEIVFSTAEVTSARIEAGALVFKLYSKGKSSIRLRLNREPKGAPTIGTEPVEHRYYPVTRLFDIDIPAARDASGRLTLRVPCDFLKGPPATPQEKWVTPVNIEPTIRVPVRSDVGYGLFPATQTARTDEPVSFSFVHPPDCKKKCKATVSAGDLIVSQVEAEKSPAFTIRAPYARAYIRQINWTLENEGKAYSGAGQVIFLAPGSAVAFERDVDRDGYSDYILENEKLRVILYPHAGARSFALVRKSTNTSAFTSIGGMRDVFRVQIDAPGQERLPLWTRHGIPGMHNRFYDGRITQESGGYAEVSLSYMAPDVAPKGALLERVVRLPGNGDYVEVAYTITPNDTTADQGYINLNSVALGPMEDENATVLRSDRLQPDIGSEPQGNIEECAWVALASRDGKDFFGMGWGAGDFQRVEYDRRDYSLLLRLVSQPWKPGEKSHHYRVRYLYASDSPQARQLLLPPPR